MQISKKITLTYTLREDEPFQIYPGSINELERQEFEEEEKRKKKRNKKEEGGEEGGEAGGNRQKGGCFLKQQQRVMTYRRL
jgi:hypothetical protein